MTEKKSILDPETIKHWSIDIFNSINDGLLIADREGIIQFANPQYLRIIGQRAEDVMFRPVGEVRPGAMLPTVIKTGRPKSGVYRKVGEVEYIVDMSPIIVDDEIIGGVSVVRDITEIQKLTQELGRTKHRLQKLQGAMEGIFSARYTLQQLVGVSAAFKSCREIAEKAAMVDSHVLLIGESGTGKELLAQGIHNASLRKHKPFVAVNCAAIPSALLESELFGYSEGAFTGSKKGGKIGLFQLADGGTLFLDEIADMGLELQAKLLRVLQEQTIRRLGELSEKKVDVRIIAATNQDLEKMADKGSFRKDLYYRINVFQISLPALRERKEDILSLTDYFIGQYSAHGLRPGLSAEVRQLFLAYDWPGNIRELKNAIEFACNMVSTEREILLRHLPARMLRQADQITVTVRQGTLEERVRIFEKQLIEDLLKLYGDTSEGKRKVCAALDISLASLYRKMKGVFSQK